MDVEAWLQGLGLERYITAFRDNEINWAVLPKLTADDLRDIGVTAVGHRRMLLEAIAQLSATDASPDPIPPSAPAGGSPLPHPPLPRLVPGIIGEAKAGAEAERRQLTIMFCDLVGSTPLASTPRICARSSASTTGASPTPSAALVVSSPSIWATAC